MVDATTRRVSDEWWKDLYERQWDVQAGTSELAPFWPDIDIEIENYEELQYKSKTSRVSRMIQVAEIMRLRDISGSCEEALLTRLK